MAQHFGMGTKSIDNVRRRYRATRPDISSVTASEESEPAEIPALKVALIETIKRSDGLNVFSLADTLDVAPKRVRDCVAELKAEGFNINVGDELEISLQKTPVTNYQTLKCDFHSDTMIFGIISDTHLASRYECLEELWTFYNECKALGISKVFHCGDITAGQHVYPGQENEIKCWGQDAQVQYCADNYPRIEGVTTYYITGNHDLRDFESSGADRGVRIANLREDMVYLGPSFAKLAIHPHVTLELVHLAGGSSYALSYPLQKYIEGIEGGTKPKILACGHLHTAVYTDERNINALLAACFEAQTPYERRKKLSPVVGGWIIEINVREDGWINRFVPHFLRYYPKVEPQDQQSILEEAISQ